MLFALSPKDYLCLTPNLQALFPSRVQCRYLDFQEPSLSCIPPPSTQIRIDLYSYAQGMTLGAYATAKVTGKAAGAAQDPVIVASMEQAEP